MKKVTGGVEHLADKEKLRENKQKKKEDRKINDSVKVYILIHSMFYICIMVSYLFNNFIIVW